MYKKEEQEEQPDAAQLADVRLLVPQPVRLLR